MEIKTLFLIPFVTILIGFLFTNDRSGTENKTSVKMADITPGDTAEFDQEKALNMLREEIKGMEDRPSSEVFKNIKVMKQVPAGRLLRIMEFGFGNSLGVTCTHCHNPDNFADEDKPQKQIARDMMAMVGKINNELLVNISGLDSENPVINCTTCHRGQVIPALNLEKGQ